MKKIIFLMLIIFLYTNSTLKARKKNAQLQVHVEDAIGHDNLHPRVGGFLRMKFLFVSFIVCCLLQGCIVIYYPYFRNLTSIPVHFELQTSLGPGAFKGCHILYTDSIIAVDKNTYRRLRDTIKLQQQSDRLFQLEVPAHSTVCMPALIRLDEEDVIILRSGLISDTMKAGTLKAKGAGRRLFHIDFTGKAGEAMYNYGLR